MIALRQATYSPAIYNVGTIEQAKRIILTPEDASTEQRWKRETPYLLSLIEKSIAIDKNSMVLDYGCGIGRMSKALIERFGCWVVGVDISPSMRELAYSYVSSDQFLVCAPDSTVMTGNNFDLALAIWVLQHCCDPSEDIARIRDALKPDGDLFVVNDRRRIVPCKEVTWFNDGKDVAQMLGVVPQSLDPEIIGHRIADASYWAVKSWAQ
jgi:Methylase involved in ubiquinone/menaquinone biosynthesis